MYVKIILNYAKEKNSEFQVFYEQMVTISTFIILDYVDYYSVLFYLFF